MADAELRQPPSRLTFATDPRDRPLAALWAETIALLAFPPMDSEAHLATLIVRHVEPELVTALKRRATNHGRTMEAEHRELLRLWVDGPVRRPLAAVLLNLPEYRWKPPR